MYLSLRKEEQDVMLFFDSTAVMYAFDWGACTVSVQGTHLIEERGQRVYKVGI